jgi:hypothetical protein
MDIATFLDSVAERVEKEKLAPSIDLESSQSLQNALMAIVQNVCAVGAEGDNLLKMMAIQNAIQRKSNPKTNSKPANALSGSRSGSTVTPEIVVKAMQHIYSLARCWCKRVTCQAFTMGRVSSTWSEVQHNSIKHQIKPTKLMGGEYTLSSFVADVDLWIHKQFEKAFQANKITYRFRSDVLSDSHVSLLQQVLHNGAVSDLLNKVIPNTMKGEFTVHESEEKQLDSLCALFRKRVIEYVQIFRITTSEIKFLKATSLPASEGCKPSTASRDSNDEVNASLLVASDIVNNSSDEHVVAVYFPCNGDCKIPFFNQNRPLGHGVPLYCSCMKQTASGLPCEHQMSWILRNPRSVWTIIFLCNPSFIRGHPVA